MMAGIRSSGTRPEMMVRRGLHARGWRYRLHDRRLPGRPDLVFPARCAVILINGCFWHGHDCDLFRWPTTRPDFWSAKIAANIARDRRVREALLASGWRIGEVWECMLKGRERMPVEDLLGACEAFLRSETPLCIVGGDRRVAVAL